MSDLSQDLVEEILCRVPITSLGVVRSICKGWNVLSKTRILCKAKPKNQFLGFIMKNLRRLCSMRFNFHGINEELVDLSIKEIDNLLNQVGFREVFYCDGLLLCVTEERNTRFVVWNPYLGQTRWIQPKTTTRDTCTYAFGYDNNKNHKILRLFDNQDHYEIYDLKSNSWRVFDVIPNWEINSHYRSIFASVNGNAYFWTKERIKEQNSFEIPSSLICFDFTADKFGQLLLLPFQHYGMDIGILSCVKEEKLSALYQCSDTYVTEIWITTTTEPNALLWIPFFKFDIEPLTEFGRLFYEECDNFIIDEKKKLAVIFYLANGLGSYNAYIIGENICLKKVDLKEVETFGFPIVSASSYVPSLVQIKEEEEQ